jgi:hypothetical protein
MVKTSHAYIILVEILVVNTACYKNERRIRTSYFVVSKMLLSGAVKTIYVNISFSGVFNFDWPSGTRAGSSPSFFDFLCYHHSTIAPSSAVTEVCDNPYQAAHYQSFISDPSLGWLQSEVKLPDVEGTGGIAPHVLHFSSS